MTEGVAMLVLKERQSVSFDTWLQRDIVLGEACIWGEIGIGVWQGGVAN